MAEYQARSGAQNTGDPAPDTIEYHWIRTLERDLWARFWGPGVVCANYDSGTEYERCTGWDQSGELALSMGDVTGNPFDHHTTHGSCVDIFTVSITSPAEFYNIGHGLSEGDILRLFTTGALPTGLIENTDYNVSLIDDDTFNLYPVFTVTIASPAEFTSPGHGHTAGDILQLSTTGALPTGLIENTDYVVSVIDSNTFNLYPVFTVTIASPAVFTSPAHGLAAGDILQLSTTGALPTGLTQNINYNVSVIDSNTFNLSIDVIATAIVVGTEYTIKTVGNTVWTSVGAPANSAVGTTFTASSAGDPNSGTGVATTIINTSGSQTPVHQYNLLINTSGTQSGVHQVNLLINTFVSQTGVHSYSEGAYTNKQACEAVGRTWAGVTSNDPADVDPANPIDRVPVDAGREIKETTAGYVDMTNHPLTSTVALQQHLAIQIRINESIARTGHSTGGQGQNRVPLPEVTKWGALRGSDATTLVAAGLDLSRVRDDHVNQMSDEIESIGSPLNSTSIGTYNFNKIHTVGIHGDKDEAVYNETSNEVSGVWTGVNWGNDSWTNPPWSPGGTNTGIERPFAEARYRFANWGDFRYFFNQGGEVRIDPAYSSDGSHGGNTWYNLCRGEIYIGQHAPYAENIGDSTTFVQGAVPRAHAIADQPNHYISDTGTAGTTNGTTITGLTTTNMAAGDILHIGSWFGEIKTVSSTTVELQQNLRNLGGTAQSGTISSQDWSCSKWYQAGYFQGGSGLYGTSVSFPTPGNTGSSSGYVYIDWRLDFLDGPMDLFVRCMYHNTMLITINGTGTINFGRRSPVDALYFKANHLMGLITKDNASTAETISERYRST